MDSRSNNPHSQPPQIDSSADNVTLKSGRSLQFAMRRFFSWLTNAILDFVGFQQASAWNAGRLLGIEEGNSRGLEEGFSQGHTQGLDDGKLIVELRPGTLD